MHGIDSALLFWLFTFALIPLLDLMSRPESFFPGRHDKLVWGFFLLFMNLLGAILYWHWKRIVADEAARDMKLQEMKEASLAKMRPSGASPDAPLA
jgi:hypothetical protein